MPGQHPPQARAGGAGAGSTYRSPHATEKITWQKVGAAGKGFLVLALCLEVAASIFIATVFFSASYDFHIFENIPWARVEFDERHVYLGLNRLGVVTSNTTHDDRAFAYGGDNCKLLLKVGADDEDTCSACEDAGRGALIFLIISFLFQIPATIFSVFRCKSKSNTRKARIGATATSWIAAVCSLVAILWFSEVCFLKLTERRHFDAAFFVCAIAIATQMFVTLVHCFTPHTKKVIETILVTERGVYSQPVDHPPSSSFEELWEVVDEYPANNGAAPTSNVPMGAPGTGYTLPQGVQYYPVQHLPTTAMPQGAFNPHFGHQPSVVYRSDLHADPYPPGHGDQGRYNAVV